MLGSWRRTVPLIAVGIGLLIASIVLVARDLRVVRQDAESEIVALAEASADAIELETTGNLDEYLSALLRHPAVQKATVYSATAGRTTRARAESGRPSWSAQWIASLREPIVGCRAIGSDSICLTGDMSYLSRRADALVLPHLLILAASAFLLAATLFLARGSGRQEIAEIARIVRSAADESNYSARAPAAAGDVGQLSGSVNKLLEQMQQRDVVLRRRTTELENANKELEAFSYSVSHDLRSPLASVDGFTQVLSEAYGEKLDDEGKEYLKWIRDGIDQMKNLVSGLLQMSRLARADLERAHVDLSAMAASIAESLRLRDPQRNVEFIIEPGLAAEGDERLLHAVLENLLSNAFKFTKKKEAAVIEVRARDEKGKRTYFVRDNGAGFDSTQAAKMFTPFQRLHAYSDFEGTGIGLSTVKRIVERHGGSIWADGEPGAGATFYFTLGDATSGEHAGNRVELSRA